MQIGNIPSGFAELDKMINGWHNSDLIVLEAALQWEKQPLGYLYSDMSQ